MAHHCIKVKIKYLHEYTQKFIFWRLPFFLDTDSCHSLAQTLWASHAEGHAVCHLHPCASVIPVHANIRAPFQSLALITTGLSLEDSQVSLRSREGADL